MQRWIVAAVVFVVLFAGGLGFGYRAYKQSRPTQIWLPIPAAEFELAQRKELAALLKKELSDLALLERASKDSGYAKEMGHPTDAEAAKDLQRRLFSEIGTADTPTGKVPTINVGFNCKVKEYQKMQKIADRLKIDIGIVLGQAVSRPEPMF